jgi:uncharacterized protein (DUF342 family)
MHDSPTTPKDAFEIQVSPDRMKATLCIAQGAEVSAASIISRLREMKIARFDDGLVIEALGRGNNEALAIEVAKGVPPADGKPDCIEYLVPVAEGGVSHAARVTDGQIAAKFTPGLPGNVGCDVFGEPLTARTNTVIQLGRNLHADGEKVVCTKPGILRLANNVLSVEPLLELRGDTDFDSPVDFDGDAIIKGTLTEGHILRLSGSLSVGGAIEAVQLNVGGSVQVQGGVIGKKNVQSDITESRLVCGGRLTVEQGTIFGGAVAANGGLACATLGNPGHAPTVIEVGEGLASRSILTSINLQIEANQKRVSEVRGRIAPLLKIMKSLTPDQREKVTELLFQADETEAATRKLTDDLETQTRDLKSKSLKEIFVARVVHPGVTLRFPHVKTIITETFQGPFRIVTHEQDGSTQIVLIGSAENASIVLPTHPIELAPSTPQRRVA